MHLEYGTINAHTRVSLHGIAHIARHWQSTEHKMTGEGNGCRAYRKAVVAAMPGLHHLDDMPVTDKERRLAAAFMQGGLEVCLLPSGCCLQPGR